MATFIYNPSCANAPGVRVYHGNTRAEKQKDRAMRLFVVAVVLQQFNENNRWIFLLLRRALFNLQPAAAEPPPQPLLPARRGT